MGKQRGCGRRCVRLQVALDLFNKVLLGVARNKDPVDTRVRLTGAFTDSIQLPSVSPQLRAHEGSKAITPLRVSLLSELNERTCEPMRVHFIFFHEACFPQPQVRH